LAAVGGWELDLVTKEVTWSAETARLHGVEPDYRPTFDEGIDFYAPEARSVVQAAVEIAITHGQGWEMELPIVRADGGRIWARIVASVESVNGRPVRLVGAFQDVTTRVAEKVALEEIKTRFALATESGGIAIWDWDISQDRFTLDDRMYRLYGVDRETVDTSDLEFWVRHLHPDDRSGVEQALKACLEGASPCDEEFRIIWDDSSLHYIKANGQVVARDEAGRAIRMVGTNLDITERKEAEEASKRARVEAEEANRAKSNFLANMSHEIRTPMNEIIGMTYLALRAQPAPEQRKYLTKISGAADSLLVIINDILDFSKMEAGKMELENVPFSLKEVLSNLHDIVIHAATQKDIAIVLSTAPDVPPYLLG
jgi:PAS domain S-box-containing protein